MKKILFHSVVKASSIMVVLSLSFMLFEPALSFGAAGGSQMTESLTINKEISFVSPTSNVTLSPALGGITGGTATGRTSFAIVSNDTAGYTVSIQASSSVGMIGNASSSNSLTAYKPAVTGVPDYTFTVRNASGVAFGYTVDASTTSDLEPAFLDNDTSCNTGSTDPGLVNCWLNASTTAVNIIDRTQPTYSGGTPLDNYTIAFQTTVNANPNPVIPNDTYVATTTLTATMN